MHRSARRAARLLGSPVFGLHCFFHGSRRTSHVRCGSAPPAPPSPPCFVLHRPRHFPSASMLQSSGSSHTCVCACVLSETMLRVSLAGGRVLCGGARVRGNGAVGYGAGLCGRWLARCDALARMLARAVSVVRNFFVALAWLSDGVCLVHNSFTILTCASASRRPSHAARPACHTCRRSHSLCNRVHAHVSRQPQSDAHECACSQGARARAWLTRQVGWPRLASGCCPAAQLAACTWDRPVVRTFSTATCSGVWSLAGAVTGAPASVSPGAGVGGGPCGIAGPRVWASREGVR